MPFLIQGNADAVYKAAKLAYFTAPGTTTVDIEKDIPRTIFLGSAEECQYHIDQWANPQKSDHKHYAQGNMSAGNLFFIHGPFPFRNPEDDDFVYQKNKENICFAFVDKNKNLCGLSLYFYKNDPSKWMIGLIKNTNKLPNERQVYVLTSVKPDLESTADPSFSVKSVDACDNDMLKNINHPLLGQYLQNIIQADDSLNLGCSIIEHFTQYVNPRTSYEENDFLLQALETRIPHIFYHEALNVLLKLSRNFSPAKIYACLNEKGLLFHEICRLGNESDTDLAKEKAELLFYLHDIERLDKSDKILNNPVLVKEIIALWDKVDHNFLRSIFDQDYRIDCLHFLATTSFFSILLPQLQDKDHSVWQKLSALSYWSWISTNDFLSAFVCQLLLNLPHLYVQDFVVLSNLKGLLKLEEILDPIELANLLSFNGVLQRSFIDALNTCITKEQMQALKTLFQLGVSEPAKLQGYIEQVSFVSAINTLNEKKLANKEGMYQTLLAENPKARDFMQIINYCNLQPDGTTGIELAHEAISSRCMKSIYQKIQPKNEWFIYRLDIINRARVLELDEELISLLFQQGKKADLFFKAVGEVELGCIEIKNRLYDESREKYQALRKPEKEYRKAMYNAIFQQVNEPCETKFLQAVQKAEAPILAVAGVDRHPWLRRELMLIVNAITLIFTLGLLNAVHKHASGDFLFFSRPSSAEKLKILNKDVERMVATPAV